MDGFYNKGHKLATDNLYTWPELLDALHENGTDCFGTLRKKEGLPHDFWKWKPPKVFGEQPIIKFCNSFMVCRWNDAYKVKKDKIVSMMSTVHTGKITQSERIHYSTKEKVQKPDVILDYKKSMGGGVLTTFVALFHIQSNVAV